VVSDKKHYGPAHLLLVTGIFGPEKIP